MNPPVIGLLQTALDAYRNVTQQLKLTAIETAAFRRKYYN